jgi:hypothetical protein
VHERRKLIEIAQLLCPKTGEGVLGKGILKDL